MKKACICAMLAFAMALSLTACSPTSQADPSASPSSTGPMATQNQPVAPGNTPVPTNGTTTPNPIPPGNTPHLNPVPTETPAQ